MVPIENVKINTLLQYNCSLIVFFLNALQDAKNVFNKCHSSTIFHTQIWSDILNKKEIPDYQIKQIIFTQQNIIYLLSYLCIKV